MSIGTSHVFNKLDKASKALDGQRLVRLIAKGKNKSPNLDESLCVSIPVTGTDEVVKRINDLLPYVVGMVQDTQDKIIREYRIESGASDIHEDLFNLDQVVAWLAANATGERLTAEAIKEWIMEDYMEPIHEWLRRLPKLAGAADEVIYARFNGIRDLISKFADPRASFTMPQLRLIQQLGEDIEQDSRMTGIQARVSKMIEDAEKANAELQELL